MSSAVQPAHPTPASKQWWSKAPSASKSSTVSYRSPKPPSSATPPTLSNKLSKIPHQGAVTEQPQSHQPSHRPPQRVASKPSLKFNTLTSVFKSKKSNSPTIVPPGPISPPLPFQNPPPASPPRLRTKTVGSGLSYYSGGSGGAGPKSPVDPSIYTVPSSEDGTLEPLTPSDQLSARQRSSYPHQFHYPPSLLTTFSDQQDASRYLSSGDRAERDRRISVMSDPSIIDPHLKRDYSMSKSSARASSSSYYGTSSQYKSKPQLGSKNIPHGVYTNERRKSSIDSRPSREIDLSSSYGSSSSNRPKSAELRLGNSIRAPDSTRPTLPHLTMSGPSSSALRRNNSTVPTALGSARSAATVTAINSSFNSRSNSPASIAVSESGRRGQTPTRLDNDSCPPSSARLSPNIGLASGSVVRPKASSVSQGSSSGSSQSILRSSSGNTTHSSSTLSRTTSVGSGVTGVSASGSVSNARVLQRQPSSSRIRGAVPPSRTPPPAFDLPPTPGGRPPSPLTFRSPNRTSTSSLNSPSSAASDEQSIMAFELPPVTPSSDDSASSKGMTFAQPSPGGLGKEKETSDRGPFSSLRHNLREARNSPRSVTSPVTSPVRSKEEYYSRPATQPLHSKSSFTSTHALVHALSGGGRGGETPTQRSVRKSASQQSISAFIGRERKRVDSATSTTSSTLMSEESSSIFGSVGKTLKKQRSLHATRGAGHGGLPIPPLPQSQPLRHASSFSATNASIDGCLDDSSRAHSKLDSPASNLGSHRRPTTSSTPVSTTTNSSALSSPATPQMQKKRSLFNRERRDSNTPNERDRQEVTNILHGNEASHSNDKRKAHNSQTSGLGINLGIFGGHFSSSSGSHADHPHERSPISPRDEPLSPQQVPQSPEMRSPSPIAPPALDQHIVPPKELEMMLRMESLSDVQEPSSPLQFSSIASDGPEDEWSLDNSSVLDTGSVRSRMGSVSDASSAFGRSDTASMKSIPSSPVVSTRHFASAIGSIAVRLQSDRPSTTSRLPMRNPSGLSRDLYVQRNVRPSTAQTFGMRTSTEYQQISPSRNQVSNGNELPSDNDYVPIALPPPPRRKGMAVSLPYRDDEPATPLPPPPPPSQVSGRLQRLASHETISTYNPNRGSIFRKPSFLNIDDEFADQMDSMSAVPEDSFLILDGKDSLDIRRSLDSSNGVLF